MSRVVTMLVHGDERVVFWGDALQALRTYSRKLKWRITLTLGVLGEERGRKERRKLLQQLDSLLEGVVACSGPDSQRQVKWLEKAATKPGLGFAITARLRRAAARAGSFAENDRAATREFHRVSDSVVSTGGKVRTTHSLKRRRVITYG